MYIYAYITIFMPVLYSAFDIQQNVGVLKFCKTIRRMHYNSRANRYQTENILQTTDNMHSITRNF